MDVQNQILIEQRITNEKPSVAVAYLLLIFLGIFGGHRFYLHRTGSAVAMLVLDVTVLGFIVTAVWVFIDLFLIPGMIREDTEKLRQKLTLEEMARQTTMTSPGATRAVMPAGSAAA